MSLSYYNPFRSLTASNMFNSAKLVGAGKLAEGALQVFSPKQNIGMAPYRNGSTKTMTKRKQRRGTKKTKLATVAAVKRMIVGREEKKFYANAFTAATLIDTTIYTANITAQIASGTEDGNRIGDSINLTNFEGRIRWYTDTEASYYTLRVLVFWCGEEYNPSSSLFSSAGFGGTQLFKPYNAAVPTHAITNPKAITVLHYGYIEMNSALNGYEEGASHFINVKLGGQKFDYRQDLSVYGKRKNLYVCVIGGFKSSNADPPENAGALLMNYSINYTDS